MEFRIRDRHNIAVEILYLDNHLLVLNKPTGVLVQADDTGRPDVLSEAKLYIKKVYNKPGNVFLGLVHRLDRSASGVLVLARTSKSASRVSAQFRSREVEKTYFAMVEGRLTEPATLHQWLQPMGKKMKVRNEPAPGSQKSVLAIRPALVLGRESLVEIDLETGRRHQIRAQLAAAGHPVVGDTLYGSKQGRVPDSIALHCTALALDHPTKRERFGWAARPPRSWPREAVRHIKEHPNYLDRTS